MLDPRACGLFVRVHLGALIPGCHPPHWIGSVEIVDRGSGWSAADRRTFDEHLGDARAQLDETHALCEALGYPKQRHHVRIVIADDVLFFEDEQGRVGQSYFADGHREMVYAAGDPDRRYPDARFGSAVVCPWLWYTP